MNCPTCRTRLDGTAPTCPACGASVLDQLVATKVDEALARREANEGRTADRAMYQAMLEQNEREPRAPLLGAARLLTRWAAIFAFIWVGLGVVPHFFIFNQVGWSPAGLVCPLHCEGCSGPGRLFVSIEEGTWQAEKGRMGYALLCAGPGVDPDTWTLGAIAGPRNTELQPFLMNGIWSWFVEGILFSFGFGLLAVGLRLPGRAQRLDAQKAALVKKLASLR